MNNDWNINVDVSINYINACKKFVEDDQQFNNFKRDVDYLEILEHISKEESDILISEMKDLKSLTKYQIEKFKENDFYGNPYLYDYEKFSLISPSTIRYIKNVLDIRNFISDFDIKNILEIGGGYGGLCKTLSVLINYENYLLVDISEVNQLSKKYLSKFSDIKNKIIHFDYNQIKINEIENIDLLISNYAFSECSREIQTIYYENLIKNSKTFYITYNNFIKDNMSSDEFIEIASKNFEIQIESEVRKYHTNLILYGVNKNENT